MSLRTKVLAQFSFTDLEPVSRFKFQNRLHIFHWIFCQTSIMPWRSELDRNVRHVVFNVMLLHQCLQCSCNNSTFLNSRTNNAVHFFHNKAPLSSESSRASGKLSVSFPLCLALFLCPFLYHICCHSRWPSLHLACSRVSFGQWEAYKPFLRTWRRVP